MLPRTPLRIAVIGAGPAGLHAAEQAICHGAREVHVDVIEAKPSAFGLIRPIRLIDGAVDPLPDRYLRPHLRLIGNVTVGRDIGREELESFYDAVTDTVGAPVTPVDLTAVRPGAVGDLTDLLALRSHPFTTWCGWYRLDESVRRGRKGWSETVTRAQLIPVCDQ